MRKLARKLRDAAPTARQATGPSPSRSSPRYSLGSLDGAHRAGLDRRPAATPASSEGRHRRRATRPPTTRRAHTPDCTDPYERRRRRRLRLVRDSCRRCTHRRNHWRDSDFNGCLNGRSVLAIPKSASQTCPSASKMLPGLTSRWMMPFRCA